MRGLILAAIAYAISDICATAANQNAALGEYSGLKAPQAAITCRRRSIPNMPRREFCGTENHPYEHYLELNGIEHRRPRVRTPTTNVFAERFNGTVLDEFQGEDARDLLMTASRRSRSISTPGLSLLG